MKEPRNQDCDARAPNKEKWSRLQWGSPHRGHCPSVLEVVVSRLASQVGDASTCGSRSTPKDGAKRKSRKLPQEEEEKGKGLMVGEPYHGWRSSSTDSGEDATATRRTSHSYKIRILEQRTPKKNEFLEENFQELFQKNKLSQNIKKKVLTLARDREASMRCRRITAMAPAETSGNLKARTPRDDACGHGSWIPSHRSRVLARLLKTQFDHETGV
ncbi:hypothetical protein BHM03_00022382 [Ensete ventricosum]|nr:hypothetical protein BHM03_00022382 [Ensete ventricosum]